MTTGGKGLRVLLLYPPMTVHALERANISPPSLLGLCSLAAVVRRDGHIPMILDGFRPSPDPVHSDAEKSRYGISDQEILQGMLAFKPDLIGISSMYSQHCQDAHAMAALAKQRFPEIPVVVGGAHATILPEVVLEDPHIDLVVIGEGEATLSELLECMAHGGDGKGIPGTAFRDGSVIRRSPPRLLITDLDSLPFPAWDLLDGRRSEYDRERAKNWYVLRPPLGFMLSSRGCPHRCYFCAFHHAMGGRWRPRSAKSVVDELEFLVRVRGCREVHFLDDNCSVSPSRLTAICQEILRRGLVVKIATPSGIGVNPLNEGVLRAMKKAGFFRLAFGIETGDPQSQKLIDKRVDLKHARQLIGQANRLGFWTTGTFILGHPHETKKEIAVTIEFAKRSHLDMAAFLLLIPQLETKAWEALQSEGLIDHDSSWARPGNPEWYKLSRLYEHGVRTRLFSNQDLHVIKDGAYRAFLLHKIFSPRTYMNLLRKMRSLEDLRYLAGLFWIPLKMLVAALLGKGASYLPRRPATRDQTRAR